MLGYSGDCRYPLTSTPYSQVAENHSGLKETCGGKDLILAAQSFSYSPPCGSPCPPNPVVLCCLSSSLPVLTVPAAKFLPKLCLLPPPSAQAGLWTLNPILYLNLVLPPLIPSPNALHPGQLKKKKSLCKQGGKVHLTQNQ